VCVQQGTADWLAPAPPGLARPQRFFARHEFSAQHLLCCSDCEPLRMSELLHMADKESKRRWGSLATRWTRGRKQAARAAQEGRVGAPG
jgi:hypothetical protein